MSDRFKAIQCNSVFDLTDRSETLIDIVPGQSLSYYFPKLDSKACVATVSGERVDFNYRPIPKDEVLILLVPLGGENNAKSILRLAAFATASIYVPALGGKAATTLLGTAAKGSFGFNLLSGAATVGATLGTSLLINKILPPQQTVDDDLDDSPTYGIDGAKSVSREGVPFQMFYGKMRQSGNIVGYYVDQKDNRNQYITILMCLGEAPISDVTDIWFDGQPIENYSNWAYAVKLSRDANPNPSQWEIINYADNVTTPEDRAITAPKISRSVSPISVGLDLTADDGEGNDGWITYTTTKTVDRFRVDLAAPRGLGAYSTNNRFLSHTVEIEIEYKVNSGSNWTPLRADLLEVSDVLTLYRYNDGRIATRLGSGEFVRDDRIVTGRYERLLSEPTNVFVETATIGSVHTTSLFTDNLAVAGKSTNTLRFSIESPKLSEAVYDVRVRRKSPAYNNDEFDSDPTFLDVLQWTDLNEIESEVIGYQGSCMIAIRALLTDQLQRAPNITVLNHGRMIEGWLGGPSDQYGWTVSNYSNPAWIAWDILTSRLGASLDPGRLNLFAFKRWADFCNEKNLQFNGGFDVNTNIWDALQEVFRTGRAQLIPTGTNFTVSIEQKKEPVMTFGNGNIKAGTLGYTWENSIDRSNEIEMHYFDREEGYRERVVRVSAALTPQEQRRSAVVRRFGVTSKEQAIREATLQMNLNNNVRQSVSFEAPLEAIGVTLGDNILVAQDHALWAFTGRTKKHLPNTPNDSLELDRDITLEVGIDYELVIHSPHSRLGVAVVSELSALPGGESSFRVNGAQQVELVDNMVATIGVDQYPITGFANGWYKTTKELPSDTVGQLVEFEQTDMLERYDIIDVTANTETNVVTVEGNIALYGKSHSDAFSKRNWMIGRKDSVGKEFTVTGIRSGADDYHKRIVAAEYNEESLVDDSIAQVESSDTLLPDYITVVQNLSIRDTYRSEGSATVANVALSWDYPVVGLYEGAIIYASINGGDIKTVGRTSGSVSSWEMDFSLDDYVAFRVVAYDKNNNTAPYSASPVTALFLNSTINVASPENLTATVSNSSVTLAWTDPVNHIGIEGVRIFRGPNINLEDATIIYESSNPTNIYEDLIAPGASVNYWVMYQGLNVLRTESAVEGPISASAPEINTGNGSTTYTANSNNQPTPQNIGDLWYQPDTGVTLRSSDGVSWDSEPWDSRYEYLPDSTPLPDPNFNLSASGQDAFWETIDVTQAGITISNIGQDGSGGVKIETYSNTAAQLKLVSKQFFPANSTDTYHARMIYSTPSGNHIPNFDMGIRWYDKDKNLLGSTPVHSVIGSSGTGGNWQTVAPAVVVNADDAWSDRVAYIRPYIHAVGNSTTNKEMTISSFEFEKAKDESGIANNATTDVVVGLRNIHGISEANTGSGTIHYPVVTDYIDVPGGLSGHYAELKFSWSGKALESSVRVHMWIDYEQSSNGQWVNILGPGPTSVGYYVEHFLLSHTDSIGPSNFVPKVPRYTEDGHSNSQSFIVYEPGAGPFRVRLGMRGISANPWRAEFDLLKIDVILHKK